MPIDNYKWLELQLRLQAAALLLRDQDDLDDQGGTSLRIEAREAIVGIFINAPTRSANDVAAVVFILVPILSYYCAKTCAKFVVFGVLFCKTHSPRYLEATAPEPAPLLGFAHFGLAFVLCHSDHLPTVTGQPPVKLVE